MPGGVGGAQPMTEEVSTMVVALRSATETSAGVEFAVFEPIQYSTQVVAGTNYFVKVKTDEDQYVHVRIFQPLPHTGAPPEVHSVQVGKSEGDPIGHF
eukprot:CAMPEP_0174285428 /NCGR_PEP_ID=MMETSP0809-20121228/8764_1 /TAXON_ID=73025 ORGANISM="Eutreptiella gymnastica-like, Strain CCMP1594" /NCGR_SAMPLE_ID=MMETSP0809 /ASSEMBLY_ACC=CAM_ASM_000658 /LENGTH=97 /DNA_ID=CAMNT_0015381215 /DNA_START=28 /DNA_END=321 /DNA_ORIENTATION=+